jgi:isopentenyl-diphosphate delta-isomerase
MSTDILIPAWEEGVLRPVEKLAVHARALRHPAISVFVMDGDKTLIQQRALTKYHTPGLWANACCTHPHWGEPMATCAARRLKEELGISGLALHPRGQLEYRAEVGGGLTEHEVVSVFVGDATEGDLAITPNPEEVHATEWVTLEALRARINADPSAYTPWLAIYLSQHADQIFNQSAA